MATRGVRERGFQDVDTWLIIPATAVTPKVRSFFGEQLASHVESRARSSARLERQKQKVEAHMSSWETCWSRVRIPPGPSPISGACVRQDDRELRVEILPITQSRVRELGIERSTLHFLRKKSRREKLGHGTQKRERSWKHWSNSFRLKVLMTMCLF